MDKRHIIVGKKRTKAVVAGLIKSKGVARTQKISKMKSFETNVKALYLRCLQGFVATTLRKNNLKSRTKINGVI